MLDWVVSPDSQVISQIVSQPITKGTKVVLENDTVSRLSVSTTLPVHGWPVQIWRVPNLSEERVPSKLNTGPLVLSLVFTVQTTLFYTYDVAGARVTCLDLESSQLVRGKGSIQVV